MSSTTAPAPAIVSPHGGTLINRKLTPDEGEDFLERAESLASIRLDPRQASDLEMISIGAFSPLQGFMAQVDYEEVVSSMHLVSGEAWSIPITLSVDGETAKSISDGAEVALRNEDGRLKGSMIVEEKYTYDGEKEAAWCTAQRTRPTPEWRTYTLKARFCWEVQYDTWNSHAS